jgi:hypothetical protein
MKIHAKRIERHRFQPINRIGLLFLPSGLPSACIARGSTSPPCWLARNSASRKSTTAFFEQPADALVSEVVEAKVVHSCSDAKVLESEADRVACYGEHSLSVSALVCFQLLENRDRTT